jgi:single-strand DNA-binding protein
MLNKVQLIGHLGQNPEMRYTQSNTPVCNFSLATNEKWKDKDGNKQEHTEWHKIVVWGKQAELCNEYLSKGRRVYLEGKNKTRSWETDTGEKRYMTEVHISNVVFLGGKENGSAAQHNGQDNYAGPHSTGLGDDDLPF